MICKQIKIKIILKITKSAYKLRAVSYRQQTNGRWTNKIYSVPNSVSDPDSVNADTDPGILLNPEPDQGCCWI